ncbi:MAG TPA: hypothetical protein EYM37_00715 [Methylophaga aminisulfidivorans]|jgi:hypothetical protein|uniref:hypothetical protein n=1 Tax=Methylophaga TaxID=40222 RepID=UPI000C4F9776|nr:MULTISPECIES: hypothetical protein [Methylophaga]MAX53630.1 hypothetical protein [Methylophaga sp.]HIC46463.1 hypothetical protein [Methylophaga sp.]HIM38439.1 hypothetical protein [Methylophaga aminisulfidivorans]|tara:strand:- start:30771 stop:31520 length:750 start_codon:yes stop_codon:yes gene_type:complete
MLRTFNYTGRHKILQNEVSFEVLEEKGQSSPCFNVNFEINQRDMPKDAKLYVEAWYKETRQRFDFGTLGHIIPPTDRQLNQLDLTGTANFRVLVVDESSEHALILASGEGFRFDFNDEEKSSLLSVRALPLDNLCWKLDFDDLDKPELIINNNIPNALEKMRSDPIFQALILPSAMSQILSKYLFSEDVDIDSDGFNKWLGFSQNFTDSSPIEMDIQEREKWLDDVIEQFAKRFEFSKRLIDAYTDEEQ